MLFLALSSLYYFKERSRLFQEEKVKNRLVFSECKRINTMLGTQENCEMPLIKEIEGLKNTYYEIFIAFLIMLFFTLPSTYFLALTSLRPMRNAIDTIDSFINGIVHDINTPVSVIKLNAQSMHSQLENEKHREKNSRILQGISNIESLEEQLLFSLKSEMYNLKYSTVELSKILEDRVAFYNEVRDSVKIKLEVMPINIKVDGPIFIRMIDNIILNAIKFSYPNSEVNVSINNSLLIVEDFGVGIKDPKKIFMKYYRESDSVKGLGLGLFIVKSVADLHKIDVKVESNEGQGTRFTINLKNVKVD